MSTAPRRHDAFRHPGFPAFWTAETVSGFGTHVTTIALQVLVLVTLNGSATDVGLLNSARWLPYLLLALLSLHLTPFELGITLASAGVTGFLGSLFSTRIGLRWGAGRTIIACYALMPPAWAIIALAPVNPASDNHWFTIAVVAVGQGLYGLALGLQNANEMGYRQAVTPDALQSRMNTTIRSINRAMIVVGAPAGGLLADGIGYRPAFWIAIAGFVLVAVVVALSPVRSARHGDAPLVEARE